MAPEKLKGEDYDYKVDLWSLGIIIYILYFREYPYSLERIRDLKYENKHLKKTGDKLLDDLI